MADEGCYGGALPDKVEAEEVGGEGRVPHVQADADRGMVDRGDLLGQLGRPDRVVVDRAAHDRPLRVVVLDGDGDAELSRPGPRLPQGGPLGGELVSHAVPGVARADALAGVADHHLGADAAARTGGWRRERRAGGLWEVRSMRLTSSGAWTVYASSASSSNSPTARSLFVSRRPPRMTPRFWGQISTKSGPAAFQGPRSSASPPTPSAYSRTGWCPHSERPYGSSLPRGRTRSRAV